MNVFVEKYQFPNLFTEEEIKILNNVFLVSKLCGYDIEQYTSYNYFSIRFNELTCLVGEYTDEDLHLYSLYLRDYTKNWYYHYGAKTALIENITTEIDLRIKSTRTDIFKELKEMIENR